jgi:hypothetical protein
MYYYFYHPITAHQLKDYEQEFFNVSNRHWNYFNHETITCNWKINTTITTWGLLRVDFLHYTENFGESTALQ